MQLVISSLNPLQVSLEVAKLRLQDYGARDIWHLCYIIGNTALLAGYTFLKQDVTHLRESLEKSIYEAQRNMLNDAAAHIISSHGEIPWEQVPRLLSTDGADDLLNLYLSVTKKTKLLDVTNMKVGEIRSIALTISDSNTIQAMLIQEQKNKNRAGAIEALKQRQNQLLSQEKS